MPKPHFNINSLTYSNNILSLNYSAFKLRGGGTVRIGGLSNSISFTETRSSGRNLSYTFSVTELGTSSTSLTTQPSVTYTFGGTANSDTNLRFFIRGQQLSSATASGPTLSNYINSLVNGFSFTGRAAGFTATASHTGLTSTVIFTAPTQSGNYFNGATVSGIHVRGTSGFTMSTPNTSPAATITSTFSGGRTTYNVNVTFAKNMITPSDFIQITSLTASGPYTYA